MITSPESGSTSIPDETPHAVTGSKLTGRVALVTGGTRGIGAAIVRSLASQGASIAAGYGTGQERAEQYRQEFQSDFPDSPSACIAATSARVTTAVGFSQRPSRSTGVSTFSSTMPGLPLTGPWPR